MHHKRKRPKNRRSGCKMCKPHKQNGYKRMTSHMSRKDLKSLLNYREQLEGMWG